MSACELKWVYNYEGIYERFKLDMDSVLEWAGQGRTPYCAVSEAD